MKKKISIALTVLVVIGILVAGGFYVRKVLEARKAEPKYTTEAVGPKKIQGKITASGTLSALRTVQVGSQVSGRIESLSADFNSQVHKGDIVAKIDPQLFNAAVRQAQANAMSARAELAKAKATAADAKAKLARAQSLRAKGIDAEADLETAISTSAVADAAIDSAKADIEQAEASLNTAQTNLSYTKIASPVDGVVIARSVDVGQTVAASLQAPVLFTIAEDLSKMQIDTSITEGDIGRIGEGMKATFTVDAFSGVTFEGKIRQIRNSATTVQAVVTYDAVIDVDNPDLKLRPGMTANVTIVYQEADAAIAVPNAALRFKPAPGVVPSSSAMPGASGSAHQRGQRPPKADGTAANGGGAGAGAGAGKGAQSRKTVYVLKGDTLTPVRVKTGLTDGTSTEITDGELAEGDLVVTDTIGPTGATTSTSKQNSSSPFRSGGGRF